MQEVCFCGRSGDVRDRVPILDDDGQRALKCRSCGHLDHLEWLPEEAVLLLWGEVRRRRDFSVGQGRSAA
jgi:hypothetical protein